MRLLTTSGDRPPYYIEFPGCYFSIVHPGFLWFDCNAFSLKINSLGQSWDKYHRKTPLAYLQRELSNFAVGCVMHDIEKNGGHIASYCDHPLISPNIFFTDKEGNKSYAVVKAISQNSPDNSAFKPSAQMIERMSGTNGYLAEVICEYSYEKDNSMTPLKEGYESKILYRGYPFEFNYYGLKKIEDIVKERGTNSDIVYDIK